MQQAAWSDADEALGQALQDIPFFLRALQKLQESAPADLVPLVKRVSGGANLVLQSVRHAGRRRQLSVLTEEGSKAPYDPVIHRSDDPTKPGELVRIRKAPIIRGPVSAGIVVLSGEVEPV